MTILNGYATLTQIKATDRLNISTSDSTSDTVLEGIITAVSRAIDRDTGRYFYKSTAAETRYFTAVEDRRLFVGDIVSVSALYTDTAVGDRTYPYTWSTTDYDLYPYEADAMSEPEPFRWIDVAPQGIYRFPVGIAKGVKLSAVFGWSAVPSAITEICLLWSERWFKRYKTPLGISSFNAMGEQSVRVPPPDPDIKQMMRNYAVFGV